MSRFKEHRRIEQSIVICLFTLAGCNHNAKVVPFCLNNPGLVNSVSGAWQKEGSGELYSESVNLYLGCHSFVYSS